MKKVLLLIFSVFCTCLTWAQRAELGKQYNLATWNVPGANYSGITWLGGDRYGVVNDKDSLDGWYEFQITLDEETGAVKSAERIGQHASTLSGKARDAEGIAYFPPQQTLFVAAESDQRVLEFDQKGRFTGRELRIPAEAGKDSIYGNYGFESLTYQADTHQFWTVTEQTLKQDGEKSSANHPVPCRLRLLCFGDDLSFQGSYLYETDAPSARSVGRNYAFGVSDLAALSDGSLLVLEREFQVTKNYLGSYVKCKIYRTFPGKSTNMVLPKELVTEFTAHLNLSKKNIANYEGMCLGPKLKGDRQTLLLLSDSQNNYGNAQFHLKDYLRVVILPSDF